MTCRLAKLLKLSLSCLCMMVSDHAFRSYLPRKLVTIVFVANNERGKQDNGCMY